MILRFESTTAKDIWILGAGFSHQIYSGMPLLSGLSEDVRDIISDRFKNPLMLDNVELALSELRSNAPWKTAEEKYRDMALYESVIERIRDRLQVPWDAIQDEGNLIHRLVNTWHVNRGYVLTLNYDLLVEALAEHVRYNTYRDAVEEDYFLCPYDIYPIPIPHVRRRGGSTWGGNSGVPTFSYYKLHGSLNYYTPPDPFQNTAMYHRNYGEIEELAEGLDPFIVPPTQSKQTFLEHPSLQTIWAKAAQELVNTRSRIILVGYSMPQTDLTMLSMLREMIKPNREENGEIFPKILVVNPDFDVACHIKKLLGVCNPVGQVTDVVGFLETYAPLEFVRTHVLNNIYKEDSVRERQMYQEMERKRGGKLLQEDYEIIRKFNEERKEQGRLGEEWFISSEERSDWYRKIYQDIPVDRWL